MSDFNATQYKNDYIKQNYDRINVIVKKGKKDEIKAAAAAMKMSVNEFIGAAIDAFLAVPK